MCSPAGSAEFQTQEVRGEEGAMGLLWKCVPLFHPTSLSGLLPQQTGVLNSHCVQALPPPLELSLTRNALHPGMISPFHEVGISSNVAKLGLGKQSD